MATNSPVSHDHFVLLMGEKEFETPPAWLSDNFNIIEGGTHAGGSSRNKLIVFKDGTYLELFTWISKPKEFLAWADKPAGLIDFALTTIDTSAADYHETMSHAIASSAKAKELGVSFSSPQRGGRKRKDGVKVEWETSRPAFAEFQTPPDKKYFPSSRLDVPFFCHDVTDRIVRVPFTDPEATSHPCGAVGIASIRIVVPQHHLDAYVALYQAMLGVKEDWYMDEMHQEYASFQIRVPNKDMDDSGSSIDVYAPDGSQSYTIDEEGNKVLLEDEHEKKLMEKGIGIYSLVLRRSGRKLHGHDIGSLDDQRTVLIEPWHRDP